VYVNLDKSEVFSKPLTLATDDYVTWTYFWEGAAKR
jgi:hypothetical protein